MSNRDLLLTWIVRAVATCAVSAPVLAQGGLLDLGTLPNDLSGSGLVVSADGNTVAGSSEQKAVRWTSTGGIQDLGLAGADRAFVYGMSQDGDVVVGSLAAPGYQHPFRWDTATGMQDLGVPFGTHGRLSACNADGSVLTGEIEGHAVRWTSAVGFQSLGDIGSWFSKANAVSPDGSVIVGYAFDVAGRRRAFRWTLTTGMVDLGSIPGVDFGYSAYALSADGSVIVGHMSNNTSSTRSFCWTAAAGLHDLGDLGGAATFVTKCSSDGRIVLGRSYDASGRVCAFVWTEATGMQPLGSGPSACDKTVWDCSADGTVVVGNLLHAGTSDPHRPFRWTLARGYEDLGTLGGDRGVAIATNSSGSAVVGYARNELAHSRPYLWREGVGAPLGNVSCTSQSNSTGNGGRLRASGALVAATNFLQVEAFDLPPDVRGIVLASTVQSYTFPFPSSQGALCLGGVLSRFSSNTQIGASGAQGAFTLDLDLTSFPTPTGSVPVVAGETWTFQVWYRDRNPAPTSNFTATVAVRFL